MSRRTKIVATLGPASDSSERLGALIMAGVDVVRLNLSHGDLDEHLARMRRVRRAAELAGRPVAILADLPGPKIRCGPFPEGGVDLDTGHDVRLVPGDGPSSGDVIEVQYPPLLEDLRVDSLVHLGDGGISMRVMRVTDDHAEAEIETGGRGNGQPGVHIASETMRLTTPTEHDLGLAESVAEEGVEFVAVSFVRAGVDLDRVRDVVGDRASLVAKIETSPSVDRLEEVVDATDVVMVARGDLGIDCPIEDVPHLQKHIIRYCVAVGTPVITATQMLESMIDAPSPTRAEVTDVANAVFDGTDALMLSGETAIGHDPVNVVSTMSRIAERAEAEASYRQWADRLGRAQRQPDWGERGGADRITAALTHAASQAARDAQVSAILCCTRTGRTARAMARFRPEARLIGLSPDPRTVRAMALTWGVDPIEVDTYGSTDEMVWHAVERAVGAGLVRVGDNILVLAGAPDALPGTTSGVATDVLRIVQVA